MALSAKDRNKLIIGLALLAIAVFALYEAFVSPPPVAAPAVSRQQAARPNPLSALESSGAPAAPQRPGQAKQVGPIDPRLRLDLLEKSTSVTYQATGGRNIFSYGAPPPPPPPPKPLVNPLIKPGTSTNSSVGTMPTQVAPPPPPPIPLKYYGYAQKPNEAVKKAFLTLNDEIFIAGEGDIVAKRYRVLKIGVNTVEVEDTVTKSKQTLPLQEG